MSAIQMDEVMLEGACGGDAEEFVRGQCQIETAPNRCANANQCLYYAYYKCRERFIVSNAS